MSSRSAKANSPAVNRDTGPIRLGEELNLAALSEYLRGKIAGAEGGLSVEQFPSGHSNLTYLLRAGEREYVLRRAPPGSGGAQST